MDFSKKLTLSKLSSATKTDSTNGVVSCEYWKDVI